MKEEKLLKITPEQRLFRAIFAPKLKVLIDKDNKVLVAFIGEEKYVIRCHEQDRYDWRVGLGVAASKHLTPLYEKELTFLRRTLREKHYYLYCYNKLLDFKTEKVEKIVNDYEKEYQELLIKEQVRKAECEIRKQKYEPRKIERKFISLI